MSDHIPCTTEQQEAMDEAWHKHRRAEFLSRYEGDTSTMPRWQKALVWILVVAICAFFWIAAASIAGGKLW